MKLIKALIFLLISLSYYALPAKGDPQELKVKSKYITRFAQNVIWPSYAISQDFVIGFIGDQESYEELKALLSPLKIKNKKVRVIKFESQNDIIQCPILYINRNSKVLISGIFRKVSSQPTLVLTEKSGFADEPGGSDVNFIKSANQWLYEIVPEQIENKGILVPKRILQSAYKLIDHNAKPVLTKEVKVIEKKTEIKYVTDPKLDRRLKDYDEKLKNIRAEQEARIRKMGLSPEKERLLIGRLDSLRELHSMDSILNYQLTVEADLALAEAQREKVEKEKLDKEREISEANQRTQLSILLAIILLVSFLALTFYIFSRRRKKNLEIVNRARLELAEKVEEINRQNELLEESARIMDQRGREINEKNMALEEQNKKITDSIRYALTIQEAILPAPNKFDEFFAGHFILYEPKDIVSGDYYWLTKVENMILLAVADCTGHGVPGAFMSMIGSDLLNEIVNEKKNYDPSQILDMLDIGIYERLRQDVTNNRDGMDICLCQILPDGPEHMQVTFAGAKRHLYFTQDGNLEKLNGDSKYIGGIRRKRKPFHNHKVSLKKGEALYLTTDGYVDTPNPERRKFGGLRFQDLLAGIIDKPMNHQKEILINTLREHQNGSKSRDDITVLGVKL